MKGNRGPSPRRPKPGRPSKYDPSMCQKVIEGYESGMSDTEAAHHIGVSITTLQRWTGENVNDGDFKIPEFAEAVAWGREAAQVWWLTQGRVNLENKAFNCRLFAHNMANRYGEFSDSRRHEHTGPGGGPIESRTTVNLKDLTDDELAQLKKILMSTTGGSKA